MKNIHRFSMSIGLVAIVALGGCGGSDSGSGGNGTGGTPSTGGTGGTGGGTGGSTGGTGGGTGGNMGPCSEPKDHPADPNLSPWSYHGATDGADKWGTLPGDALCGTGMAQSPIDIASAFAVASAEDLTFTNYDKAIPVALLNNGHWLQVSYTGTMAATDPQITYAGKTYYLTQFHFHSTSEHTLNSIPYPLEVHFVHKAADDSVAFLGVFFTPGVENPVLATIMQDDPGKEKDITCTHTVKLDTLLPPVKGFFHYSGSISSPPCTEGVSWFVMQDPLEVSDAQKTAYQMKFGGTTNRPIQPLNGRVIDVFTPN